MYSTLYQKPDVELPYNIDTRYFKHVQEGVVKEKYEQRWVVLTENVNEFVEELSKSYNNLALSNVSREDRGPLTILTANYGDSELSDSYTGDGELSWWTFGGSVYSYHIRRWVNNNPDAIKEFCTSCVKNYGYAKDEVTVSCNPVAGEPRVMCEATFTPQLRNTDEEGDYSGGGGVTDEELDEEEMVEQGNSIQFNTTTDSMAVPTNSYVAQKLGLTIGEADQLITLVGRVDSGELVYKRQGQYGVTMPPSSGWYLADDNPQALQKGPEVSETGCLTADNVGRCRAAMQNVPEASFTSIRVTSTSTISSRQKINYSTLQNHFGQTGQVTQGNVSESAGSGATGGTGNAPTDVPGTNGGLGIEINPSINVGGASMQIPQSCWAATDPEGHTYPLVCSWINEGISFDATTVKSNYSTDRRVYYSGTMTQNYRTSATFATLGSGQTGSGGGCGSSTSSIGI